MTWEEIVAIGLALPGAETSTSHGRPADAERVERAWARRTPKGNKSLVTRRRGDAEKK